MRLNTGGLQRIMVNAFNKFPKRVQINDTIGMKGTHVLDFLNNKEATLQTYWKIITTFIPNAKFKIIWYIDDEENQEMIDKINDFADNINSQFYEQIEEKILEEAQPYIDEKEKKEENKRRLLREKEERRLEREKKKREKIQQDREKEEKERQEQFQAISILAGTNSEPDPVLTSLKDQYGLL